MDDELRRRLDETPTVVLLEYLRRRFGFVGEGGRGRIELEIDAQGEVLGVWRHERTSPGAFGLDPPAGSQTTWPSGK